MQCKTIEDSVLGLLMFLFDFLLEKIELESIWRHTTKTFLTRFTRSKHQEQITRKSFSLSDGGMAERSKATRLGIHSALSKIRVPKGRGFEPHFRHSFDLSTGPDLHDGKVSKNGSHSVGFEPTHGFPYLISSQAP